MNERNEIRSAAQSAVRNAFSTILVAFARRESRLCPENQWRQCGRRPARHSQHEFRRKPARQIFSFTRSQSKFTVLFKKERRKTEKFNNNRLR